MTLRDGIRDSIHESILSVFDSVDASHPQYQTTYYLDPVDARVIWYTQVGSGIPRLAYEGVWVRIFCAPARAIPQSIVDNLLKIEHVLVEDCLQFQEEGHWREKPDYSSESFEIVTFWDPADWFDVFALQEIREKWEDGLSAEEIVGELYLGDLLNGMVDYREALEWINGWIQQWEAA